MRGRERGRERGWVWGREGGEMKGRGQRGKISLQFMQVSQFLRPPGTMVGVLNQANKFTRNY